MSIEINKITNRNQLARFLIGLFFFNLASMLGHAEQVVLVAIHSDPKEVVLKGNEIRVLLNGELVRSSNSIKIGYEAGRLILNGKEFVPPLQVKSDAPIEINKKGFRGNLIVEVENDKTKQGILLIHPISLETYVAGIVASEVPESWPQESLEAQAIASRTYAVYQKYRKIDKKYHLSATVMDQVYGGLEKEHSRAEIAARNTYGQVLTFDAKPIQAFFHSSCGGRTASAGEVWGSELAYLPGGKCGFCDDINAKEWSLRIEKKTLEQNLTGQNVKNVSSVKMGKHTASGRLEKIEIVGKNKSAELDAAQLRAALGYGKLRSTMIDRVESHGNELAFYGKGFGHGVGMCQWGARGMAKEKYSAEQILAKYYPGTELRRMY